MALQSTGAISLNDIHIEAGGSSGTSCTINDSDIRGLIGKTSGAQSSFSEFYGASSVSYSAFATWAATNYPTVKSGSYQSGSGRVAAACAGSMWGSPTHWVTNDSYVAMWALHCIESTTAANYITSGSRYVVWERGVTVGNQSTSSTTRHGCTTSGYSAWPSYRANCWYYDSNLNDYRKMTSTTNNYSSFTGP